MEQSAEVTRGARILEEVIVDRFGLVRRLGLLSRLLGRLKLTGVRP